MTEGAKEEFREAFKEWPEYFEECRCDGGDATVVKDSGSTGDDDVLVS